MIKQFLQWLYLRRTNSNTVGITEDDDKVTVFVQRKMPLYEVHLKIDDSNQKEWSKKDLVPEEMRTGFKKKPTEVVELGRIVPELDREKYRPVVGGCEIRPVTARHVGTAGCIVKYYEYGGVALIGKLKGFVRILKKMGLQPVEKAAILTNSHVANKDVRKPKNDVFIQQPFGEGAIGKTLYSLPISPYDAALIDLPTKNKKEILEVGELRYLDEAKVGVGVHKYGRTTNYTVGECEYTGVRISVDYGEAGTISFPNCDIYSRMSAGGDSGSVIARVSDNAAVSLLFAGSPRVTIGNQLKPVMDKLGVELW